MTDFQPGRVFQQALYLDFIVMDSMKTLTYLKIIIQNLFYQLQLVFSPWCHISYGFEKQCLKQLIAVAISCSSSLGHIPQ